MRKFYSISFVALVFFFLSAPRVIAQVGLPALNNPVSQNFGTLAISGTGSFVPGSAGWPTGWVVVESGTNANTNYSAGTGSSNTGDTYSLGASSTTERALGGLRSGSLVPTIGASFVNNTGAIITSVDITYTGEQWRFGAVRTPAAPDRLDFQLSTNATSVTSGTWIDDNTLDFTSPVFTGTAGAQNGNTVRTTLSATISGLTISPGGVFWIRWSDFDVPSSDDALAIDDFSLTPHGVPLDQPNLVFNPTALNFGEVHTGQSRILTYFFDGSNLDSNITSLEEDAAAFSISLDGINFTDSLSATDSTTIYVKFQPAADGLVRDSVLHINDAFSKLFPMSGTGYDPLTHIIPIASARTQSVGARVTVAGRVTSADQLGSPSYLQDATGGIPVFDFNLSNNVGIGDSIIVTGPIGVFSNQVQISGTGISFFKADNSVRVLTPKAISINDLAANEGLLVTVQQVELVNKSFVFYPQSTERIKNGSVQADLRIDGDTDLPGLAKPQGVVDITGVVGRFQTNAQLLPRFREDVPGAAEPMNPSDSVAVANTFDLMNWNLEFLGAESQVYGEEFGPSNEPLQVNNIALVIMSKAPDLIAVQEVSSDTFFNQLVSQLPGYASICSPRYSHDFDDDGTFPPQKVCFIYNTSIVDVVSTRPMFEQLFDDALAGDPTPLDDYPVGGPTSFWSSGRLPFLLTADVTINHVSERINFINLHSKSGGSSLSDYNRRHYDMQVLKDSLDAQFSTEQFVILGDINDDLDQSILPGRTSPYAMIVDDTARYSPISLALSLSGAKSTVSFNDVIDHQILSNELDEEYIPGSIRILTPFQMIANYGTTTSDHLPVLSRYQFITPEVSFATSESSVMEGDSINIALAFSRPVSSNMTLSFQVGGDASYDTDFTTLPGSAGDIVLVSIAAGSTSATFRLESIDDPYHELNETATFLMLETPGLTLTSPGTHSVTIIDNDACVPVFVVSPNPTSGDVNIWTPPANEQSVVHGAMYEPNGHLVVSLDGTVDELGAAFTEALVGRRKGMYVIRLSLCGEMVMLRLIRR